MCMCVGVGSEESVENMRTTLCVCVREGGRERQAASFLFSGASGSKAAGRDNNRSCYILVVSLISA